MSVTVAYLLGTFDVWPGSPLTTSLLGSKMVRAQSQRGNPVRSPLRPLDTNAGPRRRQQWSKVEQDPTPNDACDLADAVDTLGRRLDVRDNDLAGIRSDLQAIRSTVNEHRDAIKALAARIDNHDGLIRAVCKQPAAPASTSAPPPPCEPADDDRVRHWASVHRFCRAFQQ